jgi:hypothetical protein
MGDRTLGRHKRPSKAVCRASRIRIVGYCECAPFQLWYYLNRRNVISQCVTVYGGRVLTTETISRSEWFGMSTRERVNMALKWIKRAEEAHKPRSAEIAAYDDRLAAATPALLEYMTALVGPDGKARRPSSLTLFCEDGGFKGVLNDRDSGLSLWASAECLEGLLGALDGLLQSEATPWRRAGQGGGKGKGR